MVSKAVCTSAQGAIQYYEDHLSVADYYVESIKVDRGQFIGKVAQRLGLDEATVTREKFIAFVECDLKGLGADSKRKRVSEIKYIEFTYSPPKAVSVVAALDNRVASELYVAVKDELRWFEGHVTVRDRRGSLAQQEVTRPTGEMIAALFQHETSRTNDPDFHVHALIGNVSWDQERKGYFALHYGQMLELRKTLDARIHNNLAARMGKLGYQVQTAPSGFALKEVPVLALDLFSERGKQVETVMVLLKWGYTTGQFKALFKGLSEKDKRQLLALGTEGLRSRLGTPQGIPVLYDYRIHEQAVQLTRPKKVRITSQTLREDVKRRLDQIGLVVTPPSRFALKSNLDITAAINQGSQIVFEKQSVVPLDHLLGEIVRLAPGVISNEELERQLRDNSRFLIRRMDGRELTTTREVLGEERTLLSSVILGFNQREPLHAEYRVPSSLAVTPERIKEVVSQARVRGEELTPAQAEEWLRQFSAIHRYVCTSKDQFLNIRGGAGTGKTFCLEELVGQSSQAGCPVYLCAPYGEQARVTLRNESPRLEALGKKDVARIFGEADTVDSLLVQAREDPNSFRGGDIYVDEAGLLDTPKALALVRLAERVDARVIFQGDTEQMAAVGRGQPIKLLQEELGLGMHIPRASISRRQLSMADKRLAADLSSGNDEKFMGAVEKMLQRGTIRETPPTEAIEQVAREIVEARVSGKDEVVAVSSVHRISEALAQRIHDLHVEHSGSKGQTILAVHVKRDLQPAELRSPQFYQTGNVIEYKQDNALLRAQVTSILPHAVVIATQTGSHQLPLREVRAVFDLSHIERGQGEKLLLQEKIRQGSHIFEKGSRHTILRVSGETVHFASGLKLNVNDGRIRQGDCLTDYKAQGIKGVQVRGIEDNGSAMAMANKESFHVKGTRHVQNLVLHVENKNLYVETIQRSNVKFSALQLERLQVSHEQVAAVVPAPSVNKGKLLMKVREWGHKFLSRLQGRKLSEQICHHLRVFDALRPVPKEAVAEKIALQVEETVKQIKSETITPAKKITPQLKHKPVDLVLSEAPSQRQGPRMSL